MPSHSTLLRYAHLTGLACLGALLAGWTAAPASAQTLFRVGVQEIDYFPIYAATAPDYQFRGYAREVLDLFARQEDIQLAYVPLPVRRLIREYRQGRLDLVLPDNPHWDVAAKAGMNISYSQPLLVFQDAILVQPQHLGQPLDSFRTLGFIHGFTPWKLQADIAAGRVHIKEAPSPESLIRMTLLGYIDGANMGRQVARYHLRRLGMPHALVVEPRLLELKDSYYHLSSNHHPALIARFDAFLLREKTAIDALLAKYDLQ
ncbi:ABC-type amino acid transport substrate-binding protein [Pseudomonas guineae]|uniref:ABC-type amino acid transport substrate-binding protein n=1 Tax=Pseudomonas guineae TaxID=425504 RepID=A0A1I3M778_9PSED|nr:transporter substrate-binding domain-containing protein [Pseudomonas guineae]SFI92899.1 ABC-type amino acid transport substrate-binding protein [Pseudomonas guineae]